MSELYIVSGDRKMISDETYVITFEMEHSICKNLYYEVVKKPQGEIRAFSTPNLFLMPKLINSEDKSYSYIIPPLLINDILECIDMQFSFAFDESQKKFLAITKLIPEIYGEGSTKEDAMDAMIIKAFDVALAYGKSIYHSFDKYNGLQKLVLSLLLKNLNHRKKLAIYLSESTLNNYDKHISINGHHR